MRFNRVIVMSIMVSGFFFSQAFAALPLPAKDRSPSSLDSVADLDTSKDSHILEVGDRVNVRVYPEDEYIQGIEMEISGEGNVALPLVGKIKVVGLSIADAERKLVKIIDADYLVNPEVIIDLVASEEETAIEKTIAVSVLGAVRNPGNFDVEIKDGKSVTLIQTILKAGGFSDLANIKRIKIIRKTNDSSNVIKANAESIISGKDSDIFIQEGDIIHVAESLF